MLQVITKDFHRPQEDFLITRPEVSLDKIVQIDIRTNEAGSDTQIEAEMLDLFSAMLGWQHTVVDFIEAFQITAFSGQCNDLFK
jgi:hypothetical protein